MLLVQKIQIPSRIEYGDKASAVSTSTLIVLTCNGALITITYDNHVNRIQSLAMSQQGPTILANSEGGKANLVLVHLCTSSSRQPLDVLDIEYFTNSGGLYSNPNSFLPQRLAPFGDFRRWNRVVGRVFWTIIPPC